MARAARRARQYGRGRALDPVARVAVDVSLPHLDRPFDYLVPEALADRGAAGQPGAGALRRATRRRLRPRTRAGVRARGPARVHRAVGVTRGRAHPRDRRLARAVADRWAGSVADVLRLAVPPRHARAETAGRRTAATPPRAPARSNHSGGRRGVGELRGRRHAFLSALRAGRSPRAVWPAMPGPDWPQAVSALVAATLASGRGARRGRARSPRRRSGRRRAARAAWAPATTSCSRPMSVRPSGTGGSLRSAAARSPPLSAPAQPPSHRFAISGWC